MNRLLVASADLAAERPALSRENAKHLKVLRPEAGEAFELFDGAGGFRVYRYDGAGLEAALERSSVPKPPELALFACIAKGSRWDWTLEKATELGVTQIVPLISERTIVRLDAAELEPKRERWQRVVDDAARQCGTRWVPQVAPPLKLAAALPQIAGKFTVVGALTDPPSPPILKVMADWRGQALALAIGPEGDFTPAELASLIAVAHPASFGSTILRTETAAIFGLGVLGACQHARV